MKTKKIEIYVNNELYMVCYNEFVALNNVVSLRVKHGDKNVKVIKV